MNISEIKVGMKFKENDNRFERIVTITAVDEENVIIVMDGRTKSRRPSRFHRVKRSSGYTLIDKE